MVGFGDSYQSIVNLYGKRPSNEIKRFDQGDSGVSKPNDIETIDPSDG